MRKTRTILMLLAGIAACYMVLRLTESPQWTRRRAISRGARLFATPFADVDSLVIERGALRMSLQRNGAHWRLTQPLATGADNAAVLRFLDLLEQAPLLDQLPLHDLRRRQLSLDDFGLTQPAARIVVRDQRSRYEITLGGSTPAGDGVYAVLNSAGDAVVVTDRRIMELLPSSKEQWRDRSLLGVNSGAWMAVELRRPNAPFIKLVYEDNAWQIAQPIAARASSKAVTAVIEALQAARIESFVASGNGNGAGAATESGRYGFYGLDSDSALQVQLWERGSPVGLRVRLGREVEESKGLIYALTPGDNSLVMVSNSLAQAMPPGVDAVRSRRVFAGDLAAPRRVSFQFASETVTVERDAAAEAKAWRMTAPVTMAADESGVRQVVAALQALNADAFREPENGTAAADPICRIEVESVDGNLQKVQVNGPSRHEGVYEISANAAAAWFVVNASNMPPFLVGQTQPALLARALALTLADRTVLAVPAQGLQRIAVRGEGREEVVERKTVARVEQWSVAAGVADAEALQTWALALSSLRAGAVARIGADAQALADFGLEKPWLEISIDADSANTLRQTLLIGKAIAGGGRYASVRGHDVIYELPAEIVALFERRLVVQ